MIKKILIDGVSITPFQIDDLIDYLISLPGKENQSCQITYLNAYVFCLAKRNKNLRTIILDSEIVLADGISIVWAALLIKRIRIPRCIMTNVFDKFLTSSMISECKCILIGVTEPEVKKAQERINKISGKVNIISAYSGYHTNQFYSEIFKSHQKIDMILIGMSSPKSEYLFNLARKDCKNSIIWHIGAGTIKCYAETKRRASEWVSKMKIEWLHRFIFEKHTRKRYLLYNFMFIYYLLNGILKSINRFNETSI